jgi:hypothetical protein
MGVVGHWTTYSNDSYLANRAIHDRSRQMMTLPQYYKKPLWCRASRHIIPMIVALCIGAVAIMIVDRNLSQEVVWGKVVPPTVVAGQPVHFHFGLKKFSEYGGTVKRWVTDINGQVYPLSDSPTVSDKVKEYNVETEITKEFSVPCGIAVGRAAYHSTTSLYAWWNLVQRLYPVEHDIQYDFDVRVGQWKDAQGKEACGLSTNQGLQGIPGPQGQAGGEQGLQGTQGIQGIQGNTAPIVVRPRVIHKVWIEPTALVPGQKFTVHIEATINQICPGEAHWSLVRTSDGAEVAKIVQPTAPTKLGMNNYTNTRIVPLAIPPGEYYYFASVNEFCGPDRTQFIATTEHIPFTVK